MSKGATSAKSSCHSSKSTKSKKGRPSASQMLSLLSGRPTASVRSVLTTSRESTRVESPTSVEEAKELPLEMHVVEIEKVPAEEEQQEQLSRWKTAITVCSRIFCLILCVIPVGMIVLGAIFLKKCPVEPMIPLWMIIGGAMYLLYSLIDIYEWIRNRPVSALRPCCVLFLDCLLLLLMFIWLIVGSVWIYSVWPDVVYEENDNPDYHCEKLLYLGAFSVCTAGNSAIGLYIIVCFILGCLIVRGDRK